MAAGEGVSAAGCVRRGATVTLAKTRYKGALLPLKRGPRSIPQAGRVLDSCFRRNDGLAEAQGERMT